MFRIVNLQHHFLTHPQLGLGWRQDELFKILLLWRCQVSITCFNKKKKKKKKQPEFPEIVQQMEKREGIDLQITLQVLYIPSTGKNYALSIFLLSK